MRPRRGKACFLVAGAFFLVLAAWMLTALTRNAPEGPRWDRPVEGVDWIPSVPRG